MPRYLLFCDHRASFPANATESTQDFTIGYKQHIMSIYGTLDNSHCWGKTFITHMLVYHFILLTPAH